MGVAIVLFVLGIYLSYWVVRYGVRHGVRDALRDDLLSRIRQDSENPYGRSARGRSGEQL